VRLVGPSGEQVGVVRVEDALRLAEEADLDLVEVAPDARPPVCKLMDYGKFKYESAMKARDARRNQANTQLKEIQFRPKIDEHDYATKMGHVKRFLEGGDKVKCIVRFRGREQSRPELGIRLLQRVRDETHRFATSKNQRLRTKENTVSIFLELPGVGEKRARTLIKKFTTLENLANADKERIANALGMSTDEAENIAREAKKLNDARKEKKAKQIESLENAGTTAQKAAAAHYIDSLARAALNGSGTE